MSISSLVLNALATSMSVTGGTPQNILINKSDFSTVRAILDNDAAFADRSTFKFTNKDANVSISAPNGYSQMRNSLLVTVPKTLSNGALTHNTGGFNLSFDIESTEEEITDLIMLTAQAAVAEATRAFFVRGATALSV